MGIQLTVVTPEGQPYQGEVEQVVLPGSEGDFGVLEQHERFLAALRPGVMEIRTKVSVPYEMGPSMRLTMSTRASP